MAAYELFAATTTDQFIANIKAKAEAYGWTIDLFESYLSHNRLHLHNADGAHFEIWYQSATLVNIRGCTGYSSSDIPTAQPGVSGNCQIQSSLWHLIIVGPHSIYIKSSAATTYYQNTQFGYINDKIGSWAGGICVSSAQYNIGGVLWNSYSSHPSQVLINGVWSTLSSINGGGVAGAVESELYTKMPFAYSGGILPVPILLSQFDATTPAYAHPIGYAPDVRMFNGGNVYASLEVLTINGESWVAFSHLEVGGLDPATSPTTLVRLAS